MMVKVGDLRMFLIGRNPITRDLRWVTGIILEIIEDHDPIDDRCKVLTEGGRIGYYRIHGSRGIKDEDETR